MSALPNKAKSAERLAATALEEGFPVIEISQVSEQESWRKEINRPIYHIHKWWATRLGSVFRAISLAALSPPGTNVWGAFYKRQSFEGQVVLDPFMGSGTTLGEAIKLGAKAIGCDVNPVSTFLVRQALTRVAETDLWRSYRLLERDIAPEIRRYYQTIDPETGEPIQVLYYFWVKVIETPEGESIPLFSRYVFAQDAYPRKKPKAQIICPRCWAVNEGRFDVTHFECGSCEHGFDPQQGPAQGQYVVDHHGKKHRVKALLPKNGTAPKHRLYAMLALRSNGEKIYLAAADHDLSLYEEAVGRLSREDLPLPTLAVRQGHNTDQARGYNYLHWRDFFNGRQLLCLGLLLKAILRIEDADVREQFVCLFSSALEFNNLFCSYKGEGTGAVRHMFSNHILKPERTPLENSVWGTDKSSGTFCSLFESRLLRAKRYLDEPFEVALQSDLLGERGSPRKIVVSEPIGANMTFDSWSEFSEATKGALVLNGDSARLPLPDASVDAVITDPPYFDFVHYSELSDFFFAWLAPALKDRYPWFTRDDSSDEGEVQHNDPRVFARQLSRVLAECRRVLKANGVLAFSFHHSRAEGWAAIYEAITAAGLEVVAAHPVHAEMRGASPKNAAKDPISLDAILVCRKHVHAAHYVYDAQAIFAKTAYYVQQLTEAGMSLSDADRFVIAASQTLIFATAEELSFDEMATRLEDIRRDLAAPSSPMANSRDSEDSVSRGAA